MSYAVEAEALVKEYRMGLLPWRARTIRALDGVDLKVGRGTLFSLLGPNGAGKTTLVKILSTLLLPDSGWARVAGFDVVREANNVRSRIGVVLGGERALYWRLSGWDNLWFFSQLYGIPPREAKRRVKELLEIVGLEEWAHVRVENYSKGMKQRLHIARGLINDPEVLLLDEPTIGLDPKAAREVRSIIRRIVREGRTVLLTTHYMVEAEELSDRVAIISKGRIVAEGSPEDLKSLVSGESIIELKVTGGSEVGKVLERLGGRVISVGERNGARVYRVLVPEPDSFIEALLRELKYIDASIRGLDVKSPSLEDVFIKLAGGEGG
ncbi:ABC transporter, ATP binding protein [Aeropyrum pernix]|uniref:ABC transporter, ATP binding protein n=1 Tax=Aeropyrum pernix TaxID=56636 RepID=A0A401HC35_AERPX|nr:ABC transporter ATP-binding protein [Aeropyrum pernix]GBF09983.1 ABC transporter, ATP binding protein [Aeropyrum pernix]